MAYVIEYAIGVAADPRSLRAHERREILDRFEEALVHQPSTSIRNKKMLSGLVPPWEHMPPV